jgi:hypothetical protein
VPLSPEEQHILQSTHADMSAFQTHIEGNVSLAGLQLGQQPPQPPQPGLFG